MINKTYLLFLILIFSDLQAQLFEETEKFPGVETIKMKGFNGSGGNGFWTFKILDKEGRVAIEENYRRKELRHRAAYTYNENDDIVLKVNTLDINNPERIDSIVYTYQYDDNQNIVYQHLNFSKRDSAVIVLDSISADSVFHYTRTFYLNHHQSNKLFSRQEKYHITYNQQGKIVKRIDYYFNDKSKNTTQYWYDTNERLLRRKQASDPPPTSKPIYTGGPGSDDMGFSYKLDKKNRVATRYVIVEEKKYKVATYKYTTKNQ